MDHTTYRYSSVSILEVFRNYRNPKYRLILILWFASILLCIFLGLMSSFNEWSGIEIDVGGFKAYITIHPSLIISAIWTLWFGLMWGFVPAYITTLVLAYVSGMPFWWSILFAFTDPLGLAVLALAYRSVPMGIDLRQSASIFFYVFILFISGIAGSIGSFIWTFTHAYGIGETLAMWEGKWLGAFLQGVMVNGPIFYLLTKRVAKWKDKLLTVNEWSIPSKWYVGTMFGIILIAMAGFIVSTGFLTRLQISAILIRTEDNVLVSAINTALESLTFIHFISLTLILFAVIFGYQIAINWTKLLARSRAQILALNKTLEARVEYRTKELNTFIYKVSHDLKGPLASMLGLIKIAKDDVADEEALRYFDLIHRSTDRLNFILLDLLHITTLKQGRIEYSKIDFKKLIKEILQSLENMPENHNIEFSIKVRNCKDFYGDEKLLNSIFQNLITNAIKYKKNGKIKPFVKILVDKESDILKISVEDNGLGIPPKFQDKIFEMFFRAHETSSGSGLGLYIVKSAIEKLGGKIMMQSEESVGTRFIIELPGKKGKKVKEAAEV